MRTTRRSGSLVIAIICTLVAVSFLGFASVSYFRGSVARQLDSMIQGQRAVEVAEAAIAEVAQQARLREIFAEPSSLQMLQDSFADGEFSGGVLIPQGATLEVAPAAIQDLLVDQPTLTVSPVTIRVIEYLPGRNRGRLRFVVNASARGATREHHRTLGQEYAFSFIDNGGALGILVSSAPLMRLYP